MPLNDATARASQVDPDTFAVRIDGEVVEPSSRPTELPMAQRYFLF